MHARHRLARRSRQGPGQSPSLGGMEYFFACPYCWEQISMVLDTSEQTRATQSPILGGMEYFFACPYCWEQISMVLDTSVRCRKSIRFTTDVSCLDGSCSSIRRGICWASDGHGRTLHLRSEEHT